MANRFWVPVAGSGTGNWSDTAHWSTTSGGLPLAAVPTAADDVFFDANSGTGTCTIDTTGRFCRSLDCLGYGGTLAHGSGIALSIGDASGGMLRFSAGMTYTPTGSGSAGLRFVSMSTNGGAGWPITTAGKSMGVNGSSNQFTGVGGKWVLQDAWSQVAGASITLTGGELNIGSLAHQTGSFNSSGSSVKSLTGTGSISLVTTSASTVWNLTGSNLTIASTITVIIGANSTNTRTIATNGVAQGTLTYTRSGSTGGLDITGGATFTAINFSDASNARTLRFTAGTTTTIVTAAGWNVNGTSGKLMTVTSITAATHTISVAAGIVSSDYLSLSQSIASGGGAFYAGANSTDGGSNTGWVFTIPQPVTSDVLGLVDSVSVVLTAAATITDPLGLLDSVASAAATSLSITDQLGLLDAAATAQAFAVTVSDLLGLLDSAATAQEIVVTASDPLGLVDAMTAAAAFEVTVTDPLGLVDAVATGEDIVLEISDVLGLADLLLHATDLAPADLLGFTDSLLIEVSYERTADDTLDLTDDASTAADLTVDLTDQLGFSDEASIVRDLVAVISDLLALADSTATIRGIDVTVTDPLGLADAVISGALYAPIVTDLLRLTDRIRTGHEPSIKAGPSLEPRGPATSARPAGTTVANMRPLTRIRSSEDSTP